MLHAFTLALQAEVCFNQFSSLMFIDNGPNRVAAGIGRARVADHQLYMQHAEDELKLTFAETVFDCVRPEPAIKSCHHHTTWKQVPRHLLRMTHGSSHLSYI